MKQRAGQFLAALALVGLLVRVLYIHQFRVDSDEPQHLHVVWGWSQGLTAYRDFFDNHTPLFHILYAPVLKCFGARPDILVLMRFTLLPLYLFGAGCVYWLGKTLFDRQIGMWAALFSSLYPYYFFRSIEFRADNLWGPLWLFTLVLLLDNGTGRIRAFCVGLATGALCLTSIKSALLLVAALAAAVPAWWSPGKPMPGPPFRRHLADAAAGLGGALVLPLFLIGFFWHRNALRPFVYCVIEHNLRDTVRSAISIPLFSLIALGLAIVIWVVRQFIIDSAGDRDRGQRRAFLALTVVFYLVLVRLLVLQRTRQDFIPSNPLVILLLTPLILSVGSRLMEGLLRIPSPSARAGAPALVATGAIVWILLARPIFHNGTAGHARYVSQVLQLTQPNEYVMDYKGESIFRRRPYYYVFEPVTRTLLHLGSIPDDVPENLIRTNTHVVIRDTNRLPPRTVAFLRANYLAVGQVAVSGKLLTADATGRCQFDLPVSGIYDLLTRQGRAAGNLDGTPVNGPRNLSSGQHSFQFAGPREEVAVIWSRAVEKGFTPFNPAPFLKIETEF